MDRKEAKELLPIIKAFADGKTIEVYQKGFGEWWETAKPNFDGDPKNYRVKPEPKYRPFKTQEECWEEMHKHPDFGWVRNKSSEAYCPIERVNNSISYTGIFEEYEFTDGTPFGVKEE